MIDGLLKTKKSLKVCFSANFRIGLKWTIDNERIKEWSFKKNNDKVLRGEKIITDLKQIAWG